MRLLGSLRRTKEPPVETLDLATLKSRIGEPLPKAKPQIGPAPYVRADAPPAKTRSWRRTLDRLR